MRFQDKERQRSDARRAARKADHSSPLREVVEVVDIERTSKRDGFTYTVERELLSCGHLHRPSQSWHGSYAGEATRRRCEECAAS